MHSPAELVKDNRKGTLEREALGPRGHQDLLQQAWVSPSTHLIILNPGQHHPAPKWRIQSPDAALFECRFHCEPAKSAPCGHSLQLLR